MVIFRVIVAALVVFCVVLMFTHGFWFGLATWAVGSLTLWAVLTLIELCVRVGTALSRPNVDVSVYLDLEKHPDPTRPDEPEDLIPYLMVNRNTNGRHK
jgi:hypothetical protein